MPTLPKYPKYKPSSIDWIGEIPEEWSVKKLKYVARIETGGTPPKSEESNYSENGILWVKPDNLSIFNPIKNSKEKISQSGLKSIPLIPEGSVLVNCIGDIGKIGIAGKTMVTNQQINSVIFENENLIGSFGKYIIFISKPEHEKNANKVVVPILNKTNQSNIEFPIPPQTTQTQIANYLDDKTTKIDYLIAKKTQMISLLKEERQAVINQAVTKGIDPNAKMKDSGVDWIGEISESWSVKKLKYTVTNIISKTKHEIKNLNPVMLENIQSHTGQIIHNSESRVVEGDLLEFQSNDILFSKLRPYLAKVSLAKEVNSCSGELLVLRPAREFNPKFLFWRLISSNFINLVDSSTYGTKMPRASWADFISEIKFGVPQNQEEQTQIVHFIEQKTTKIDETVTKIEKEIQLLQEYRTALISEVVTGKVKID
jgi:type I restriction enzyme S subunit